MLSTLLKVIGITPQAAVANADAADFNAATPMWTPTPK